MYLIIGTLFLTQSSIKKLLNSLEFCCCVFVSHKWFPFRRSDGREDENGGETENCQEGATTEKGRMETCVRLFFSAYANTCTF